MVWIDLAVLVAVRGLPLVLDLEQLAGHSFGALCEEYEITNTERVMERTLRS
jgi:hypothetical protein